MGKIILAVIGIAFFVSCENKPENGQQNVTVWRSTHHYINVTLKEPASDERKQEREKEISVDVTEEESYMLAFREDGTGYGSGAKPDGTGRFDFDFTWELTDDTIRITGNSNVFYPENNLEPFNEFGWKVEELYDDKMVLLEDGWSFHFDGRTPDGNHTFWTERHTYRYTFEKVK